MKRNDTKHKVKSSNFTSNNVTGRACIGISDSSKNLLAVVSFQGEDLVGESFRQLGYLTASSTNYLANPLPKSVDVKLDISTFELEILII